MDENVNDNTSLNKWYTYRKAIEDHNDGLEVLASD